MCSAADASPLAPGPRPTYSHLSDHEPTPDLGHTPKARKPQTPNHEPFPEILNPCRTPPGQNLFKPKKQCMEPFSKKAGQETSTPTQRGWDTRLRASGVVYGTPYCFGSSYGRVLEVMWLGFRCWGLGGDWSLTPRLRSLRRFA